MKVHRNSSGAPFWVENVPGGGKVRHAWLVLANVRTVIDREGLAACREAGKRWTVGWVEGDPVDPPNGTWGSAQRVGFDPLVDDEFLAGGEPWTSARAILLADDGTAWVVA